MISDEIIHLLKKRNVLSVLNEINQVQTISRAELSRRTKMTPATISSIVKKLEQLKIVHSAGVSESVRGRRPVMIQFNSQAFYLCGVDIGVEKAIALVLDLHGNIIKKEKIQFQRNMDRDDILRAVLELIRIVVFSNQEIAAKTKGIGISYPGLVNTVRGIGMVAPNRPELNNLPIVEIIEKEFHLFACLEHDGACMALGQVRFGIGRGAKNVLGLLLGRGIGSGIIIGGEIYHGMTSTAGEFGHVTVSPDGPTCGCGNRGCLEVMASGAAIAQAANRLISTGRDTTMRKKLKEGSSIDITAKDVAESALEGNSLARELMLQAAEYIGIGLAGALNILNPEMVIIGGGLSGSGEYFLERIKEVAHKRAYTFGAIQPPRFQMANYGEDANSIGAAALVLEEVLDKDSVGTLLA